MVGQGTNRLEFVLSDVRSLV